MAIGHLRDKIGKTEEAIRREQGIMDGRKCIINVLALLIRS